MNTWLITLLIAAGLWLFAAPYLGIGGGIVTVGAFVFAVLCIMKWFRPTSKFVSALPLAPKFAGILGVIILLGGILMAGWFSAYTAGLNLNLGSITGTPQASTQTANCYLATAPNLSVAFVDDITKASVNTNYAYRKVGTEAWTTGNGASASISGDVGSSWEVWVSPDNTSYYGNSGTFKIPCESYPKGEVRVGAVATAGSTTFAVKSPDDTANAAATPYDASANDKKNFKVTMSGVYQKYVGDPFASPSAMIACKYNTSTISAITAMSIDGGALPSVAVPTTQSAAAGFAYTGYQIPSLKSNGDYVFKLYVEFSADPAATSGNTTCFIDDTSVYYDGNVNLYKTGFVDEANAALGLGATVTNFTIYQK